MQEVHASMTLLQTPGWLLCRLLMPLCCLFLVFAVTSPCIYAICITAFQLRFRYMQFIAVCVSRAVYIAMPAVKLIKQDQSLPQKLLMCFAFSCRGRESLLTVWPLVAFQVSPPPLVMFTHTCLTQSVHKSQPWVIAQQQQLRFSLQSMVTCIFPLLPTCLYEACFAQVCSLLRLLGGGV